MKDTEMTDLSDGETGEMQTLEAELARAKSLSVESLADAIESIGFECTRCGACCTAHHEEESKNQTTDADTHDKSGSEPAQTTDNTPIESNGSETETHTATATTESSRIGHDAKIDAHDRTQTAHNPDQENRADAAAQSPTTEPHTATIFPDEVRELQTAVDEMENERTDTNTQSSTEWRDVARPMPYGLDNDNTTGTTFEWALQTDACGNCVFYEETDGIGSCQAHDNRPLICATYPFSVALGGTSQPMGEAVDEAGMVRAHECEGLGREITRDRAEELAATLRTRAIRELEEAISLRDTYEPPESTDGVVVHDSEGAKRLDGTPIDDQ